MGCKIIFAPQAIADLAEAVHHIAKDDPETALRIGNALIDRELSWRISRSSARLIRNAPASASWSPDPTSFSIAPTRRKAAWTFCATGTAHVESRNWVNNAELEARGLSRAANSVLLARAAQESRIFVTRDKDFGGLVFVSRWDLSGKRQAAPCWRSNHRNGKDENDFTFGHEMVCRRLACKHVRLERAVLHDRDFRLKVVNA
jgi:hypothetical protein